MIFEIDLIPVFNAMIRNQSRKQLRKINDDDDDSASFTANLFGGLLMFTIIYP